MNPLRAWLGVHRTRTAGLVLAASLLMSLLVRASVVDRIGGQQLVNPVALALLIPTVAATGVAIGCVGPALPLPNPVRARVARAAWSATLTATAFVVCTAGPATVGGSQVPTAAVARNVALATAMALVAVLLGRAMFAWLPSTVYSLVAMQFGLRTDGSVAAWAAVVDVRVTGTQVTVALLALVLTLLGYSVAQRHSLGTVRGTARAPSTG